MARRRGKPYVTKAIEAIIYTPFIFLGPTKRDRRRAAKKWLNYMMYVSEKM